MKAAIPFKKQKQDSKLRTTGVSRLFMVLILVFLVLGLRVLPAKAFESKNELTLKAAFFFSFAKFTDWPPAAFSDTETFVIGVLGKNPFGSILDTLEGKTIGNRRAVVKQYDNTTAASRCHLLFVSGAMEKEVSSVLQKLAHSPVLTVSDMKGFADKGGMIQLISINDRIRFNINHASARRSSIKISSKLLQVAHKVIGE